VWLQKPNKNLIVIICINFETKQNEIFKIDIKNKEISIKRIFDLLFDILSHKGKPKNFPSSYKENTNAK